MSERDRRNDNANHEELMDSALAGHAVILGQHEAADGPVQQVAYIKGGDVIVEEWQRGADGLWVYREGVILYKGALPKLIAFLRKKGYDEHGSPTVS